jgi:dTDP-4-amino-4,6-dideoxygalactose transaminase
VYRSEKKGERPEFFPGRMGDELAELALHQLTKLDRFNKRRVEVARRYREELKGVMTIPEWNKESIYLRASGWVKDKPGLLKKAAARGVYLGEWYDSVVEPAKDVKTQGYKVGSCPKAEWAAEHTINLPTSYYLSDKQITEVIRTVRLCLK